MPVSSFRVALLVLFTIELVGGGATYRDTLILTNVGGVAHRFARGTGPAARAKPTLVAEQTGCSPTRHAGTVREWAR